MLKHCSRPTRNLRILSVCCLLQGSNNTFLIVILDTDADIDKLIDKTEQEAEPEKTNEDGALSFSFAKIWAAEKDTLQEVVEEEDQGDSWAQALQNLTEELEKTKASEIALSGRGARRRAAAPKVCNALN